MLRVTALMDKLPNNHYNVKEGWDYVDNWPRSTLWAIWARAQGPSGRPTARVATRCARVVILAQCPILPMMYSRDITNSSL